MNNLNIFRRSRSGAVVAFFLTVFMSYIAISSTVSGKNEPAETKLTPAEIHKQHREEKARERQSHIRESMRKQLIDAQALIDNDKHKDAYPLLINARQQLGLPYDPKIETMLAEVAIAQKQYAKALKYIGNVDGAISTNNEKNRTFDPAHGSLYLLVGEIQLGMQNIEEALLTFDWVAQNAEGEVLLKAADGCGRSFIELKDYKQALECYKFALGYAKQHKKHISTDALERIVHILKGGYKRAQRYRDVERLGSDFVLYRDAEQERRNNRNYKKASEIYIQLITQAEDPHRNPYVQAATVYNAQCLVEMNKAAEAVRILRKFIDQDEYGLYRGEAIMTLGQIALERAFDGRQEDTFFDQLDKWLVAVREGKQPDPKSPRPRDSSDAEDELFDLSTSFDLVKEAAKPHITPPKHERHTDFWGNIKKNNIRPGQLVNRYTSKWYLDDLVEQCAKFRGLLAIVKGDSKQAMQHFKRILTLDKDIQEAETVGIPNEYRRLKFGADNGYLIAYPQELRLYDCPA